MIFDSVKNVNLYNIPQIAVDFISDISDDIELGRYELQNGIYANVESYTTKLPQNCNFEAHNEYVDIQILLKGCENIFLFERNKFSAKDVKEPYNSDKDIIFYNTDISVGLPCKLDGTNFILIYTHEAHAPQAACNNPEEVKKVVVKIPVKLFS